MSTKNAGLARKLGYKNVKVMLKGMPGWKKSGQSVVASNKHVKKGNIILIDVRNKAQYEASHIARAHNIPLADLADSAEDLPSVKKAPIVVYGATNADAQKAYKMIKKQGAKKVSVWSGGMASWKGNTAAGSTPEEITWKRKLGKGEISVADFMKAVNGTSNQVVLDVRTPDEVGDGKFKGAMHIPLDQIEARMSELPKGKEILAHCTTGARAEMAVQAIKKAGYKSRFVVADVECEDGECEFSE